MKHLARIGFHLERALARAQRPGPEVRFALNKGKALNYSLKLVSGMPALIQPRLKR